MNRESKPSSSTRRANDLIPRARSGPSPSQTYEGRNTPNRPTSVMNGPPPNAGTTGLIGRGTPGHAWRGRRSRPRAGRRSRTRGPTPRARPRGRSRCRSRPRGRSGASPRGPRAGRARRSPRRSLVARATAWPAGTTSCTSPIRSASAAVRTRPVRISSRALAGPDDPRQPLRPAGARRDREAHLGQAELRALRGDPDVAAQRELQAAAQRVALDRGDRRHRQAGQPGRDARLQLVRARVRRGRAGPRTRPRGSRRRTPDRRAR